VIGEVKVGDEIKAGTLLLMSSGEHSDYCVTGLFRAKRDFVVPGKPSRYATNKSRLPPEIDIEKMTADPDLTEEVETVVELHNRD
jgi:hypothetical protein